MINPSTIKGKTFTTEKNGYSPLEVDRFLTQLANDITAMTKEYSESDAKIAKLVEKVNAYRADEEALKQALITAQREANKIISDAKSKANNMIESAKGEQMKLAEQSAAECEKIVREHKERCAQLIKENTEVTEKKISAIRESYEEEKALYDDLRAEVTYFKAKLTGLYNEQIKLIMQLPTLSAEELEEYEAQFDDEEDEVEEAPVKTAPQNTAPAQAAQAKPATAQAKPVSTAKPAAPAAKDANTQKIDKILNTNSFDPVIPKQNPEDLKFGKNTGN